MKQLTITSILLASLFLFSCNDPANQAASENNTDQHNTTPNNTTIVGSDRDEHGCIGSAGYTWSVVKNDCVRLFEVATTTLVSSQDSLNNNLNVFVIFDSLKVNTEIFFPDRPSIILSKTGEDIWSKDKVELKLDNVFKLFENGKEIYHAQ